MTTQNNLSPEYSLQGKTCVVTGGTRGIGFAIAKMLLEEGAQVVINGYSQASIDRALSQFGTHRAGKVKGKAADVMHHAEVQKLFDFADREFGGVDILVNNAGIGEFAKVSALSVDQWERVIGTNLTGAFYCTKEALRRFEQRDGGYIINLSSLAAENAFAGGAAYNASKFGLNGFGEAVMLDTRYDNVRVTNVMPGSVATEFGGGGTQPVGGGVASGRNRREVSEQEAADARTWKVWPEDVAEVVRMLVRLPARAMVSQIEIRPSKPKRK